MIVREVLPEEKDQYDKIVSHVMQSWEWGEFRKKTGVEVRRLGVFDGKKLVEAYQLTIHPLPYLPFKIGYLPKSPVPSQKAIEALKKTGRENNCVFIKIEPDVQILNFKFPILNSLKVSPKSLFTKYNFIIDLTKSEEELLSQMKEKTRYNVRLAQKKGVRIEERTDDEAFEIYLKLYFETTKRQKYFGHTLDYHRLMWRVLKPAGMARILIAFYNETPLTVWMIFKFGKTLYYPYGGSSDLHREVMASNLVMWEAIKLGKKLDCTTFDLWGALGPEAKPDDPWQGFHRFKEGYGGKRVEYLGTYDLVINQPLWRLFNLVDQIRWIFLRLGK